MISINGKKWDKLRLKDVETFLKEVDDDETFFIEYKTEDIRNEQVTKEIAAFANSFGGYLFLGVDNTKNIVGCSLEKWSELKINTVICNGISPMPQFEIKKFKLNNSKLLFVIRVEEGKMPPYINNSGKVYQRVSSSSSPIKDANTLNNLYLKKQNNIKSMEDKLYYPEISGEIPNNLCGYIDFGFSLTVRNIEKIYKQLDNMNADQISEILKKYDSNYSISKVGYSVCISIGESSMRMGDKKIPTLAGLSNFMEILSDGSFRCRILITSDADSNIGNITSITYIFTLFADIYKNIFGDKLIKNFIEAYHYEKLTVLQLFQPKIILSGTEERLKRFNDYYTNHIMKYGNNLIISNNRVPLTGFWKIDKFTFETNKIKFDSENLYEELFHTCYHLLGYVDKLPQENNQDK